MCLAQALGFGGVFWYSLWLCRRCVGTGYPVSDTAVSDTGSVQGTETLVLDTGSVPVTGVCFDTGTYAFGAGNPKFFEFRILGF